MSSVVIAGDTSGTITLQAPAAAGSTVITLPSTSGNLVATGTTGQVTQAMLSTNVAGNGPAFSAYQSAATSVSNNTSTKVAFNTELFDTNSNYDTANYRFQPTVAGYYLATAVCRDGVGAVINYVQVSIQKTGATIASDLRPAGGYGPSPFATCITYMNGSTDYLEVYYYQNSGSTVTINAAQSASLFSASLLRAA